jgi:carbonic anhydrase
VQGGRRFPHPENPEEALAVLVEGNRRHQDNRPEIRDHSPVEDPAVRQQPFAAIITCADSRVSPTLIFDVERGNIFVSRVAGNSVDTGTLGSTEYAVAVLGVKLVLVLGHSDCGAVKAAIEVANGTSSYPPGVQGAIGAVIDRLVPPILSLPPAERTLPTCVSVNARTQAAGTASREPIVKPALESGQIDVVASVYDIRTGRVSLI